MKLIPTTTNPVTITLYRGIPFDNNYSEHTLLSNQFKYHGLTGGADNPVDIGQNKENFINMKNGNNVYIYPRVTKTGTYNFAFGNGLVTSVVMELTGDEINSNYMKVVSGNDSYYYFITDIVQKNEVTYMLNLELDVFMTYSEEFLTNIKDKPVMVERKHCRRLIKRRTTQLPINIERAINMSCFNQESTFSGVKSNIVKNVEKLSFKNYITSVSGSPIDYNSIISKLKWIYIIIGKGDGVLDDKYSENNITYPYGVICVPAQDMSLDIIDNGITHQTNIRPNLVLRDFVGSPAVQKIIISHTPPFKECSNMYMTIINDEIHWVVLNGSYDVTEQSFYSGINQTGTFFHHKITTQYPATGIYYIQNGYGGLYELSEKTSYFSASDTETSILSPRDTNEMKLQISPFKDLRMSSYYGGEYSIPTQMLFLKLFNEGNNKIKPVTIASSNPESNSYFDYVNLDEKDVESKRGILNSVAYNFPTGTNAEMLYNQTSKNQYENSKLITSIKSGLVTLGGLFSMAFGKGREKVAGALEFGSGVIGEISPIIEMTSKMKDLKNTPNTYNFSGNSFPFDVSMSNISIGERDLLPYLITYGVDDITYNMAGEFLYHYGYEYNAESYFSTDLRSGTDNIFERQLFNYVKIREDISSKIVGTNLPLIVAKKISEVLNAGIKFWNFLKMDLTNTTISTSVLTNYFQKSIYCNAEFYNQN